MSEGTFSNSNLSGDEPAGFFSGKVAVVTGASSGIGQATALEFSRRGAVVVLAARDEEKLRFLELDIRAANGEALVVPTDVADEGSVAELVRRVVERYGGIDILVNNAGLGLSGAVGELRVEDLRYLYEVNVFGVVRCVQAALPHLRDGGRIVNVSSVVGKRSIPRVGGYSSSKFALNALTEALRVELADRRVRVTSVYPGTTVTGFSENSLRTGETKKGWRPKGVPAEKVARRLARAVERGERDAYVSVKDWFFVALVTLLPGVADRLIPTFIGE